MLALLLTLSMTAHAGFFSDLCVRFLVSDDPYQFEQTPVESLEREFERLSIRRAWNTATKNDLIYLKLIGDEIKRREQLKGLPK